MRSREHGLETKGDLSDALALGLGHRSVELVVVKGDDPADRLGRRSIERSEDSDSSIVLSLVARTGRSIHQPRFGSTFTSEDAVQVVRQARQVPRGCRVGLRSHDEVVYGPKAQLAAIDEASQRGIDPLEILLLGQRELELESLAHVAVRDYDI